MNTKQRTLGEIIQDIVSSILIALLIAVIIRVFFIEAFYIPSSSMENSFKPDDKILIWKFLYNKRVPLIKKSLGFGISLKRHDVIVFKLDNHKDDYVKRIIGLPGDRILFKDHKIYINEKKIKEQYIKNRQNIYYINSVYEVPENKVFVLGDNRNNSSDSRDFGFVPIDNIIGKVFMIYHPFNRIRFY